MSTIADIISALGGRRGRNAMYREDPIYGAPAVDETLDMPGLDEEIGPDGKRRIVAGGPESSTFKVPGEVRQVGSRPARLSRLGSILNTLPDLARGAMAGVMAPTTNSGLDFVAGAQAAGDDKERRDALAMNRQRQAQQDRMNAELHQSQIEENRAQGRRADAQAQLAMQPKVSGKPQQKSFIEHDAEMRAKGYTDPNYIMSSYIKSPYYGAPAIAFKNNPDQYEERAAIAALEELKKNPQADPDGSKVAAAQSALEEARKRRDERTKSLRPIPKVQLFRDVGGKAMRLDNKGAVVPLKTADGQDVIPDKKTSNPRPFKVTASDKRYDNEMIIGEATTAVMQEYQKAQQQYPGMTREQFAQNIYNPNYFKQIPIGLRAAVANAFLKGGSTPGKSKSGNSTSPQNNPAKAAAARQAAQSSQPLSGKTSSGIGYTVNQ